MRMDFSFPPSHRSFVRVKASPWDASASVRGQACSRHVALRSCRHSSALTAAPHDASSPSVVNAPDLQLGSVAHYVADRGAVSPRSTPIVRRGLWDCATAPEGINRWEEDKSLPLRSFPSSSFSLLSSARKARRRSSPRARHCRSSPPPDST